MTHDANREMSRDMDSIIFSQTGRKMARTVGAGKGCQCVSGAGIVSGNVITAYTVIIHRCSTTILHSLTHTSCSALQLHVLERTAASSPARAAAQPT